MPIKFVPFIPEPAEGQAVLQNFNRILKYKGSDAVKSVLQRGMPLYEMETLETVGENKDGNMVIRGECVSACAYLKEKGIQVDLVYIDPPFASGADYAKKVYIRRNPKVAEAIQKGDDFGRSDFGAGRKVMVEYVSANPTGPMHMGNARGGALGDCLASVLDAAGYEVWREFYINDAGNQIEKFGLSLDIRYQQHILGDGAVELPEDAYHGDDIKDHAAAFAAIHGDAYIKVDTAERRQALIAYALPLNIEKMKADMAKYRIVYDRWFTESTLHNNGELKEIIDILTEKGLTYVKDGALWYKAGEYGEKYQPKKHFRKIHLQTTQLQEVLHHKA